VLGEAPLQVLESFIQTGMLEAGELSDAVNHKFKVPELKAMLKKKGLKVTGKKEELAQRLIDADAQAMVDATRGLTVLRCTTAGGQLAQDYVDREDQRRTAAEQQVLDLLARGEYEQASRAVARFEASQVFARGMGIDWNNHSPAANVRELELVFNSTPAILSGVSSDRLPPMRLAAAMMELWGTGDARPWLPKGFETGIHLGGNAACAMLVFSAHHHRMLDGLEAHHADGRVKLEWSTAGNDSVCPECRPFAGRFYSVKEARGLTPHPKCTSPYGCRCMLLTRNAGLPGVL
jgi:hypothetical protein